MNDVAKGLIAGAAGTTALNAVTYLDMAVRGRPASDTPERSVGRLAQLAHVDVGQGETGRNRKAGLGPLLGYANGAAVAVGFSALARRRLPTAAALVTLAATAMVASNLPMTALRLTDPRHWSATDWLSDVIPHAVYGWVTAVTLSQLDSPRWRK